MNYKSLSDPGSRLGVYIGYSTCHAGSVALILNINTLHVSPQFHVTYDDLFSTVPYLALSDVPPNWAKLVKQSEMTLENDDNLAKTWMDSQMNPEEYLINQEGEIHTNMRSSLI